MNPYLESFEAACKSSRHVRINEQRLSELAKAWVEEPLPIPDWRAPVFPEEDNDTFINFLGVGNTINFCFTDPETKLKYATEYRGKAWFGAFAMWAALKRALDENIPIFDPKFLMRLTPKQIKRIFLGGPPLPMLEERLLCLRTAGVTLARRFGGSYANLFRRCEFKAFNNGNGIAEQLVRYDFCYHDAAFHRPSGLLLRFHKRANLFVMMYHGRALASGGALSLIGDAPDITPPADYDVPKALRHLGILEYSAELARAVDSGAAIPKQSEQEIEIRLCAVVAMRRLCELLSCTIAALDYKVWSAGKESPLPHHLTYTIAY